VVEVVLAEVPRVQARCAAEECARKKGMEEVQPRRNHGEGYHNTHDVPEGKPGAGCEVVGRWALFGSCSGSLRKQ